jgi:hypothetical protein
MSRRKNKKQHTNIKLSNDVAPQSSDSQEPQLTCPAPVLSVSRAPTSEPSPEPSSEPVTELEQEPPIEMQSSDAADPGEKDAFVVAQADVAIKRGGEKFYDYYLQYRNLREIARAINGLQQSAPFPRQLSIQKITIDFTIDGVAKTAESAEPKKVGDIAPLISFAIRNVIEKMHNELHVLSYLVTGMRDAVQTAFNSCAMAPPAGDYDNTNTQL